MYFLSSNSLLTPRGIYFGGPSTYLPLAKKLPFQNSTIWTPKSLFQTYLFLSEPRIFRNFFTIMYYSNTYQHRKLPLWRYNGHISFYRVQISWNIRMNQGWIKDESVGCVKPYTVVPKVFRLFLPTPNPIH